LIAGIYPLTQVYQHKADKENGDHSFSMLLGVKGTFIFCSFMFLLADLFFLQYFKNNSMNFEFFLLQGLLLPVIAYFGNWMLKVFKNLSEASFKNLMRMNYIASICMNICFILFIILKSLR
jgi:1,4-dihydroxy-2-naphthoate octaprenyltransferase